MPSHFSRRGSDESLRPDDSISSVGSRASHSSRQSSSSRYVPAQRLASITPGRAETVISDATSRPRESSRQSTTSRSSRAEPSLSGRRSSTSRSSRSSYTESDLYSDFDRMDIGSSASRRSRNREDLARQYGANPNAKGIYVAEPGARRPDFDALRMDPLLEVRETDNAYIVSAPSPEVMGRALDRQGRLSSRRHYEDDHDDYDDGASGYTASTVRPVPTSASRRSSYAGAPSSRASGYDDDYSRVPSSVAGSRAGRSAYEPSTYSSSSRRSGYEPSSYTSSSRRSGYESSSGRRSSRSGASRSGSSYDDS